ncbi:hypothetical protein B0H14DRAFT_660126 [Mycena olivaceomarginata]|nr:hypothetical protein B0H14DRAFT_660126 [Mycena olivaceomarginata]
MRRGESGRRGQDGRACVCLVDCEMMHRARTARAGHLGDRSGLTVTQHARKRMRAGVDGSAQLRGRLARSGQTAWDGAGREEKAGTSEAGDGEDESGEDENGKEWATCEDRDRAEGTRARRGHKRGQELQLIASARAKLYGGVGVLQRGWRGRYRAMALYAELETAFQSRCASAGGDRRKGIPAWTWSSGKRDSPCPCTSIYSACLHVRASGEWCYKYLKS